MNTSNITNYKPKDFAELLGVSVKTLQRWDREGTLKANRTPTDRRYYTYDQYLQFKGINTEDDQRQVVIYARVSTKNQKDDLQNQVAFLRQFCNAKGIIVDQCIEDYGSGLNYNRKKWNELLDEEQLETEKKRAEKAENMCKGMQDLLEDAREEGRKEMQEQLETEKKRAEKAENMCKGMQDLLEDAREEVRKEMQEQLETEKKRTENIEAELEKYRNRFGEI